MPTSTLSLPAFRAQKRAQYQRLAAIWRRECGAMNEAGRLLVGKCLASLWHDAEGLS